MANFTEPYVLHDVIYDPEKRRLHVPVLIPKDVCELPESLELTTELYDDDVDMIIKIKEPTYSMNYFHHCFFHVYLDETLPVLSILHDIDKERLSAREFRLCSFKLMEEDIFMNKSLISDGIYKNDYKHFHMAMSKYPILHELKKPHHFNTLILGGKYASQRSIHNHASIYPERYTDEPHANDEKRRYWLTVAKDILSKQLGLKKPTKNTKTKVLVIGRRGVRALLPKTLCRLEIMLSERDDIDFMGIYYLEDISLREQIILFQEADIIIGNHGSGLSHLIWSKPETKMFEIFVSIDDRAILFKYLCEFMNLDYHVYIEENVVLTTDVSFDCGDAMFEAVEDLIKQLRKSAEELKDADRLICGEV
jgi:hypothetical protein